MKCLFIILIFIGVKAYSQESNKCIENIDFLLETLKEKSPSYKFTVKNKITFAKLVDSIKSVSLKDINKYNCSKYLQNILREIQDGHLTILVKNDFDFKDSISVSNFLESEKFNSLPIIEIDKIWNGNETKDFYNSLNEDIKILIIEESKNLFKGYVIETGSKFWRKGELILKYSKTTNSYEGTIYNFKKDPRYFRTHTLEELLRKFNISKYNRDECKIFNESKEKLSTRVINENTFYVSIRSFRNGTKEENNEFNMFFENSVLPNYEKYDNIIFDVRNNPGGAMAYYNLLKGIKKNKETKNIYLLQNRKTASAAEIFILDLSEIKNVTTIGENTMGMTAFRDIELIQLPNYDYLLFLPIKIFDKNYKDHLKYEFVGIPPKIELNENENWLEKTIEIINKNFR